MVNTTIFDSNSAALFQFLFKFGEDSYPASHDLPALHRFRFAAAAHPDYAFYSLDENSNK